ncbi:hypothetical protein DL771_009332 [Monosporascus sp. 5C6A]|nr:hypothetical protein DL771_009332 [Monosporascus sp. 5C6A]
MRFAQIVSVLFTGQNRHQIRGEAPGRAATVQRLPLYRRERQRLVHLRDLSRRGGTRGSASQTKCAKLGNHSTDRGNVLNLKRSFSDSRIWIPRGGWVHESLLTGLPSSHGIAGAQQHLPKVPIRELYWHHVVDVHDGTVLMSAVNENGQYDVATVRVGDMWYIPEGVPHTIQGLERENKHLLVLDNGVFEIRGGLHLGPVPNPYITNGTADDVTRRNVAGGNGPLTGNASLVYHAEDHPLEEVARGGGTLARHRQRHVTAPKRIAETVVTLRPGICGSCTGTLMQWLALTPADIVANLLRIPVYAAENLKMEKQIHVKGT